MGKFFRRERALPGWARILLGAGSLLFFLLGVASVPQAVQDAVRNIPFLGQPAPWAVIVALAVVLGYIAIRSGHEVPAQALGSSSEGQRKEKTEEAAPGLEQFYPPYAYYRMRTGITGGGNVCLDSGFLEPVNFSQ